MCTTMTGSKLAITDVHSHDWFKVLLLNTCSPLAPIVPLLLCWKRCPHSQCSQFKILPDVSYPISIPPYPGLLSKLCSVFSLSTLPASLPPSSSPRTHVLIPAASCLICLRSFSDITGNGTPPSLSFKRVGSRDRVSLFCLAKKGAEACHVALTSLASRVS